MVPEGKGADVLPDSFRSYVFSHSHHVVCNSGRVSTSSEFCSMDMVLCNHIYYGVSISSTHGLHQIYAEGTRGQQKAIDRTGELSYEESVSP